MYQKCISKLLITGVAFAAIAHPKPVANHSQQRTAVVFTFAVGSGSTVNPENLSAQACRQEKSPAPDALTVDPKILDTISSQLQLRLSEKHRSW